MHQPELIIIKVSKTSIYLKNIMEWARDNPAMSDVLTIPFDELVFEIDRIADDLRPVFEKNQDFILSKISEISGYEWLEDMSVIYVYPIPFFNSFSHPLFLKVCSVKDGRVVKRPMGLNLGMLIHELVHNNMRGLPIDREENERLINFIVNNILGSISREYFEDYNQFHRKIGAEIKSDLIPEEIKSGKSSIKDFYDNNR